MRILQILILSKKSTLLLSLILLCGAILLGQAKVYAATNYPLVVSPDKRHLNDQNGIPFLINGDSPWSLIVGMTKTEAEQFFSDRSLKGFNTILVELIDTIVGPANKDGEQPFTTSGDFSTPNEAYFAHVDWVINKAAENNILVLLTPAYLGYGCGDQGWCQQMKANSLDVLRGYGRYLGNRYKNYKNIIWVEGGDTSAIEGGVIQELRAITEGIKEVDSVNLHTAHCDRQRSAMDCYDESWLDINNTYSGCSQSVLKTKTDYNRSRLMPFFYIEGTYENEGASEKCLRSQAYWSILGGSTGHVFGNSPIWQSSAGWQAELDSAGSQSMLHMGALFHSRSWHLLVPDYDHTVVVAGFGSLADTSYAAVARTTDGSSVLVYMPTSRQVTVDMTKVAGSAAKAWWFDPAMGVAILVGNFQNSGTRDFNPPASGDWVLVLDNADLDLPPPGSAPLVSGGNADLWISMTGSSNTVFQGEQFSYTLTVTNDGPDAASAVTVIDTLPSGVTFVSATTPQGNCAVLSNTVTCSLGNVAQGSMLSIEVVLFATVAGTLTNLASVVPNEPDPVSNNNSSSVRTIVVANEPPSITTHPNPQSVVEGQAATFSVMATGDSLSYQWQRDGVAIAGATNTNYTTPILSLGDNGVTYNCVISNAQGSVTSNDAVLSVTGDSTANPTPDPEKSNNDDIQSSENGGGGSLDILLLIGLSIAIVLFSFAPRKVRGTV